MATANKIVSQAQYWVGCKESNGSHKKIIDVYNAHKPLARNYKVKYTDAWCATFVSAVAVKCKATDIIPTECSCPQQIELFKKLGTWHENENMTPKPGDIVYYDWQDSGSGDNKGVSDHVGIVESVSTTSFTVIEGNYSNAVKRRTLKVNGRYIRGFARPKYSGETAAKPAATAKATIDKTPDTIKEVQVYLNEYYGCNLKENGIYDTATKKAIVKEVQEVIGTDVDGYFQTKSKAAWGNRVIEKGIEGKLVRLVQFMLICRGYSVGSCGADGECGKDTEAAVEKFQKKNGLTVDGECGKNTAAKLFG